MVYSEYLVDKVRRVLEGWKARLLSFSGPIKLIKSVLTSIPIYTSASAYVPKGSLKRVERIICNFLWHVQGRALIGLIGRRFASQLMKVDWKFGISLMGSLCGKFSRGILFGLDLHRLNLVEATIIYSSLGFLLFGTPL